MKAKLEFNMPEETADLNLSLKSRDLAMAIVELDEELRSILKYEDRVLIEIEQVRQLIREKLEERDINMEELY